MRPRKNPLFISEGFRAEEEVGVNIFDDIAPYEVRADAGTITVKKLSPVLTGDALKIKFNAFVDGTMLLYRVASANYTGTPLYIACISAAVLVRGKDKLLRNTEFSRCLNLVLFPFKKYEEHIANRRVMLDIDVKDFNEALKVAVTRRGFRFFLESDIGGSIGGASQPRGFSLSGSWVVCDTSFRGIGVEAGLSLIADEKELYNPNRIKDIARARSRYLMGLLEFYCLYKYLQKNPDRYVLADGLVYPYRKVHKVFQIERHDYEQKMKNVVGFIKHPRRIPPDVFSMLPEIGETDYVEWEGRVSEAEVDASKKKTDVHLQQGAEIYKFALLRFRSNPHLQCTPVGIVKLQMGRETSSVEDIVTAVKYEKLPNPSDRRRLYNEPYPIEIAEKIARTLLPSEARVRGFVLSVIPAAGY